jgi:imidazolonepropionase-like amidohydrolase
MAEQFSIHTSTLFDPKKKSWLRDISITVDPRNGSIVRVFERDTPLDTLPPNDIDLRGKYVMPGFVDAHAHIFLHSYA